MHLRAGLRIRREDSARHQGLAGPVVNLSHFPAHNLGKDAVHQGADLSPAAEVMLQGDHLLRLEGVRLRIVGGEPILLLDKQPGHGLPEPVDALLHVSHHEQIGALPGEQIEDQLLHLVDVLALVDHDLLIPLGKGLRGGGPADVSLPPLRQEPEGVVLQIRIVQHPQRLLFFLQALVEVPHQGKERLRPGKQQGPVLPEIPVRKGQEPLEKPRGDVLGLLPPSFQELQEVRIPVLPDGLQGLLVKSQLRRLRKPAGSCQLPKGPKLLEVGAEGLPILVLHLRILAHQLQRTLCQPDALLQGGSRMPGGGPGPGGIVQTALLPVHGKGLLQEIQREGKGADEVVHGENQVCQRPIVPGAGELHQAGEGRISGGVGGFQGFTQNLLLEDGKLRLLGDPLIP